MLQSQGGVLQVTMSFNTATDLQGLVRYCYVTNNSQEAPTLVVNPGDKLIIHFTNNLPVLAGMMPNMNPCSGMMGVNMTNIHFHGTDITPTCGQDEVVHTLVSPGQSFDYNVIIPADEPLGLYWYHPHPHGISEGQVQGGGTGALIIQGIQNVYPALAGMPTRTLVIRDQTLPASEANDSNIPAWDLSLNYVPVTYPSYTPAVIQTVPAEKELWRVANTAADAILDLQYAVNGTAQPMQVYAIDGYPLSSGSATTMTTVQLGPGARAEFVVTTPNVGDTAQLITQYQNTGPDGDYDPMRPIANVVSSTAAATPAQVSTQTGGTVNNALFKGLAGLTPAAHRNLYFSKVLQNPADPNSPTNFYIVPNQTVTLTATVTDVTTGKPTPTGQVQFELNGNNVGNPTTISNGQATLTTAVNGNVGTNSLTTLYEGDATYAATTSVPTSITISDFALTSTGATAAVGSAVIATVNVNVANNYTNVIALACMLPSTLTEAACFVDPNTITGTGTVQLTVNTTPAHPSELQRPGSEPTAHFRTTTVQCCLYLQ